jgi:hypothetical protein
VSPWLAAVNALLKVFLAFAKFVPDAVLVPAVLTQNVAIVLPLAIGLFTGRSN